MTYLQTSNIAKSLFYNESHFAKLQSCLFSISSTSYAGHVLNVDHVKISFWSHHIEDCWWLITPSLQHPEHTAFSFPNVRVTLTRSPPHPASKLETSENNKVYNLFSCWNFKIGWIRSVQNSHLENEMPVTRDLFSYLLMKRV